MLPIVFQALPKWDGNYNSTALTISKMLSENRKVFYVEHPYSYMDKLKSDNDEKIIRREGTEWEIPFKEHPNFIVIHPPYTLPLNKLPDGFLYRFMIKRYIRKLWNKIDTVLEEFDITEFGYINSFDPVYFDFESEIPCKFRIYHSVDLISGEPYIARHGVKAEEVASRKADQVITTSYPLKERLSVWNSNTSCIPNAADFNHFSDDFPIPAEYEGRTKKRIIYTGNIGLRIDYPLLKRVAKAHPNVEFWIVGPKDPSYFKGEQLENISNIFFTGPKAYDILPAYIHHADACIIPFICNELTHHIYPLKLNEYLSAGKPIITSSFTDFGEFKDALYIYNSDQEAIEQVTEALLESPNLFKDQRINLASQNTWEIRITDWEKVIRCLE